MDMFMGVEGETYDMVDGKPVLKEELQELYSSNFDSFSNDYGLYDTYWMLRNKPLVDQWRMENPDYITQMSDWANAHAATRNSTRSWRIMYSGAKTTATRRSLNTNRTCWIRARKCCRNNTLHRIAEGGTGNGRPPFSALR